MLPIWVPLLITPKRFTQDELVNGRQSGVKTVSPRTAPSEFAPGAHVILREGSKPAIIVRSSNTTLDLTNFQLYGNRTAQQEGYTGVGILFDHCKDLVVKNGLVHGYRINVLLRDCQNVRIEGMRVGRSHADPIATATNQPIEKFLNLRDVDLWTSYGAGIWLHNCTKCHLVRCRGRNAQNGAVLVTSSGCTIYNCEFGYNSGWGIALWGSSDNRLIWNHVDFCNRPWSGQWGGDSAGMVVAANSNENVIVGNSMTHCGDGLFLTDRVEGGWNEVDRKFNFEDSSNHNVVWKNDASWASANAFEATFSHDNLFGENQAQDSTYGFWLGYSSHSLIASNHIDRNEHDGVAIEHGQANRIVSNFFDSNREAAVHLWSIPGPKDASQPSIDNVAAYNSIANCGVPFDLKGSSKTTLLSNDQNGPDKGAQANTDLEPIWKVPDSVTAALQLKPAKWKTYRESGLPVGQAWIEPSPYSPQIFQNFGATKVNSTSYKLWFLKPPTNLHAPSWITLKSSEDPHYVTATANLSDVDGADQTATIRFDPIPLPISPFASNPVTIPTPPAKPPINQLLLRFRTGNWDCKWFKWKDISYDDRKGWLYLFNSTPLAEQNLPILNGDYSEKSPVPGTLPLDHYALLATRRFSFNSGIYRFSTISDDGIRLFVDGREIISRWDHHTGTSDSVQVPLTAGTHDLRVEYFQEDGGARLKVDWSRVRGIMHPSPKSSTTRTSKPRPVVEP